MEICQQLTATEPVESMTASGWERPFAAGQATDSNQPEGDDRYSKAADRTL
jgi:hypothetical protein